MNTYIIIVHSALFPFHLYPLLICHSLFIESMWSTYLYSLSGSCVNNDIFSAGSTTACMCASVFTLYDQIYLPVTPYMVIHFNFFCSKHNIACRCWYYNIRLYLLLWVQCCVLCACMSGPIWVCIACMLPFVVHEWHPLHTDLPASKPDIVLSNMNICCYVENVGETISHCGYHSIDSHVSSLLRYCCPLSNSTLISRYFTSIAWSKQKDRYN